MSEKKKINRNSPLTLYAQVYEILFSEIENGVWEQGSVFPTVSELSSRFDVSNITIRRVIADLVKDGLLETSRGSRTKVTRTSHTEGKAFLMANIAIIFFTEEDIPENFSVKGPWTGAVINAVQDAILDRHYSSTLIPLKSNSDFKSFVEHGIQQFSAVVPVGGAFTAEILNELRQRNIPCVIAGRPSAEIENNYVTADYYSGYSTAASILLEKGAEHFLLIMHDSYSGIQAMRGFQEALMNKGVDFSSIDILRVDNIYEASAKKTMSGYLDGKKIRKKLGIVSTGDFISAGIYKACMEHNITFPDKALLIGGASLPDSQYPVSSLKYPVKDVGTKTVSAVFKLIRTGNLTIPGIKIPMTLALNSTTGD